MRRSYGAFGALLAALALFAACSFAPKDEQIAKDVKARLFSAAELRDSRLDVVVKNGEVTLGGEAASEAARFQAYKIAMETPGVKKVHDQMTVRAAQVAPPEPQPVPEPPKPVKRVATPASPAPRATAAPAEPAPAPARAEAAPPAPVAAPAPAAPPEPKTKTVELPSGTRLTVRMIDSIDSEVHRAGEVFHASLDEPIVVEEEVIIPRGADVYVKLVEVRSAGRVAGRSELQLQLVRLTYQGKSYTLDSTTYEQKGASRGKRTAATVGGGAAIGAAIGAIAGGGKGAAIGAAIGAGTGTAVQVMTKGQQVRIPSETRLEFELEQPVEITYTPKKTSSR